MTSYFCQNKSQSSANVRRLLYHLLLTINIERHMIGKIFFSNLSVGIISIFQFIVFQGKLVTTTFIIIRVYSQSNDTFDVPTMRNYIKFTYSALSCSYLDLGCFQCFKLSEKSVAGKNVEPRCFQNVQHIPPQAH